MVYTIILFIFSAVFIGFLINQNKQKNKTINKIKEINKKLEIRFVTQEEKINELTQGLIKRREDEERSVEEEKRKIDFLIEEYKNSKLEEVRLFLEKEKQDKRIKNEQELINQLKTFDIKKEEAQRELEKTLLVLDNFKQKALAVNETILRAKKILEEENYYRIVLEESDKEDIEQLKKVEPYLHNREVLNKLIFDTYVKRPMNEMIKRVLEGSRNVCGVYKITDINSKEAYIGRSTNLSRRWQEHVKSSLGIGSIAKSSLHVAMKKNGLDNYTFEVLERVEKEKLNEREKYYIDFYETDKQLNMKSGG